MHGNNVLKKLKKKYRNTVLIKILKIFESQNYKIFAYVYDIFQNVIPSNKRTKKTQNWLHIS